jgi:hypothetical protein
VCWPSAHGVSGLLSAEATKNATYPNEQLAPENGSNTVTNQDLRAKLDCPSKISRSWKSVKLVGTHY